MGCFRAPSPWRKTVPRKRAIKRSMIFAPHSSGANSKDIPFKSRRMSRIFPKTFGEYAGDIQRIPLDHAGLQIKNSHNILICNLVIRYEKYIHPKSCSVILNFCDGFLYFVFRLVLASSGDASCGLSQPHPERREDHKAELLHVDTEFQNIDFDNRYVVDYKI